MVEYSDKLVLVFTLITFIACNLYNFQSKSKRLESIILFFCITTEKKRLAVSLFVGNFDDSIQTGLL